MAGPDVDWSRLSARAKEALEWAASSELERVVGTRGILFGTQMAAPGGEVDDLLSYFGLRRERLWSALEEARSSVRFDPAGSKREPLETLPELTENGREVLGRALELATRTAPDDQIDTAHLFGGVLAVPSGTACAALGRLLGSRLSPSMLSDLYPDYLARRHELSLGSFLSERLGRTESSSSAAGTPSPTDPFAGTSATVQRAGRELKGEVTASALAAGILRLHPEYGDGLAPQLELDTTRGRRALATAWLDEIRALVLTPVVPELHGRLVIAGLARLDNALRAQMTASGFLTTLESEIREPSINSLLPPPVELALAGGTSSDAVDPTSGIPLDRDHLDVRGYVAMLGTVVADTRTPMPLSIGLFGEWGAGKSYFMGLLRQQIKELAASESTQYHRNIAQIGFNAWHYADTNLWASLGDEIFEQLTSPKPPREGELDPDAQQRAETGTRLRAEMEDKLQLRKQLDVATEHAQAETARLTKAVEEAAADRRVSAGDFAHAVANSVAVKKQLGHAWKALGVNDAAEQGRLLRAELSGTATEVNALRQLGARPWGPTAITAAAVILVVAAVIAYASPGLRGWVAGGGLASVLLVGTAWVAWVRTGVSSLRSAAQDIAKSINETRGSAIEAKLDALRAAEAKESVLDAQRDEVIQRVGELGRELTELKPGQRLYRFVSDRASSEDYRRHLGLISTVRKDFEQLITLMAEWRTRSEEEDPPVPIDRIVLYIDDLDRCSPRQVVDVLQAVHLLLALELFVVVVGVDPRWLVQSLQSEYDKLLTSGTAEELGPASPRDYLEKIFNIPFALPRMSPTSFKLLLDSFAISEEPTPPAPPPHGANGETAEEREGDGKPETPGRTSSTPGAAAASVPAIADPTSEAAAAVAGTPTLELRPLSQPELELMAALAPLVETPRQAKRLVNLYRMVRSTRDLRPASVFLGDEGQPGEYEAVVLLLGLLTGHAALLEHVLAAPAVGTSVAGGLMRRAPTAAWSTFAADFAPRARPKTRGGGWENPVVGVIDAEALADWQKLDTGLARATPMVTLPDLSAFQFWAPRIARFSFQLSPFVSVWESEERAVDPALSR